MFYLLKNCKKREILRVILGGFWKLCFDPQKGATNKDRRRVQAYGGLPLCDPPWVCLLLSMRNWTFEHDNGRNPQTETARFYVESWETMQAENIGYLFWGGVGTGKSYLAACIANALMEKKVAVCMTNFATILNDLAASFEGRNEYISRLCSYPLLILDDFGMERGTEYGLEQVYSVIDSRYRSGKPLIATTNLTLEELQHPQDTPHARIYDRLTSMCAPVRFTGSNFRKETAQEKLERLKQLMKQRKESL